MPDDSSIFSSGVKYHSAKLLQHTVVRKKVRKDAIVPDDVSNANDDGEAKLRRYMKRLNGGFRYGNEVLRLGQFQQEFQNIISHMVAPNIVGDAWNLIGPRLCHDFGWDPGNSPQMALGKAPRRFGKTVTVAVVIVNYCIEVEGACVSAFSTSKRTSMLVKKKVMQMLVESGYETWILRHGDELIVLRDPKKPNARPSFIACYPANPRIGSTAVSHFFLFLSLSLCLSISLSRSLSRSLALSMLHPVVVLSYVLRSPCFICTL